MLPTQPPIFYVSDYLSTGDLYDSFGAIWKQLNKQISSKCIQNPLQLIIIKLIEFRSQSLRKLKKETKKQFSISICQKPTLSYKNYLSISSNSFKGGKSFEKTFTTNRTSQTTLISWLL